jgi:hypothetical protein
VYFCSSCVIGSNHREWSKESSILGVNCSTLKQ